MFAHIVNFFSNNIMMIIGIGNAILTFTYIWGTKEQLVFLYEKVYNAHDIIGALSKRQRELNDKIESLQHAITDINRTVIEIKNLQDQHVTNLKGLLDNIKASQQKKESQK